MTREKCAYLRAIASRGRRKETGGRPVRLQIGPDGEVDRRLALREAAGAVEGDRTGVAGEDPGLLDAALGRDGGERGAQGAADAAAAVRRADADLVEEE